MARKKRRKAPYIPPPHEELSRKERAPRDRRERPKRGSAPRGKYEPPPPSWGRVLRRLPLYFLIIFAVQYYMSATGPQGEELEGMRRVAFAAFNAAVVTLLFSPVMYFFDRLHYNRWLKSQGIDPAQDEARRAQHAAGRGTSRGAADEEDDDDVVEGDVVDEPQMPHSSNGRPKHVSDEDER